MKPLFKYSGSKARLIDKFSPYFPDKVDVYIEPFLGGGSMFGYVYDRYKPKLSILNDLDEELMELYYNIRETPDLFITYVEYYYYKLHNAVDKKTTYYGIREQYCQNFEDYSSVELSAMLYTMMRGCFNGMKKKYNKCNNRFSTPPGSISRTFYSQVDVDLILKWSKALQNTILLSKSFVDIGYADADLVFLDPPYRNCSINYGDDFPDVLLEQLIGTVKDNKPGSTFLCNWLDDREWWESNCEGLNIAEFNLKHTAGRGKAKYDRIEILVHK